jgi:Fe-S-cluster-containing hydrogenase component 2
MPKAVLEEARCSPEQCDSGVCVARKQCPVKAIWQEQRYETPFVSAGLCHGCSRCIAVCPARAFEMA